MLWESLRRDTAVTFTSQALFYGDDTFLDLAATNATQRKCARSRAALVEFGGRDGARGTLLNLVLAGLL